MNNHVLIDREWTGFTPSARADNPVKLAHWVRVSDEDPDASRE
jgi:DNA methyltransferase 1-associated protein 1